ncbi:MAG: fused MFS/spermidine synthase [Candidatus Omnitrophica bacterium]|jgi:spermidine synthase|nr:fused MFS/spermidine synthase [Candidatus Omnitrophota bacterium]
MNKHLNRIIGFSIILSGFVALSTQIVFIREFLVVFYGNELSIGFIFASWLISVAIGSFTFGIFSRRITQKVTLFSLCLIALSLFLPVCLVFIRLSKTIMNFNVGEIVSLFPIAAASFVLLFPVCIFFGYMFALACNLYATKIKAISGKISGVYILEAIGSGIAGILVSFFLVRLFDSLEIIVFLSIFSLIFALFLVFFSQERFRKAFMAICAALIIAFSLLLMVSGIEKINSYVSSIQWKGYKVIDSKNSIYANITVAKRGSQIVFFENGLLSAAIPDNKMIAEESVHFALLMHPNPKTVLLIGGGIGGLLDEILKYPVKQVDYLEIDPLIINLAKKHLPQDFRNGLNDKKVNIKNIDARFFVKSGKAKYDCILIHAGSPLSAQINRYYTVEFFGQLKNMLNDKGVVSFSLNSSENYLNRELKYFLQSIYASLNQNFSDIKIIPADTTYFIASNRKDYLTYDYKEILKRLNERNIDTKYVREYYLFSKLSAQRISYIENVLKEKNNAAPNYDLKPTGYFYNLVFWTTYFKDSVFTWLLKSVNALNVWMIFAGFVLLTGLVGFGRLKYISFRNEVSLFSVAVTGFSAMAIQIVILLTFQIIYGYLFYKLGFILSAFMAGLVLGSYCAVEFSIFKEAFKALRLMQFLIFVYALILPFIFNLLINTKSSSINKLGENVIFILLPAICGILCGAQFSYVNKVCLKREEDCARIGGLTYALDLFGSCIAAFATAIFLIPVIGVLQTCLLIAGMNLFVWFLLLSGSASKSR